MNLVLGVAKPRDCAAGCLQDTLVGVEGATSFMGDDLLIGGPRPNVLSGGGGNDTCVSIEEATSCEAAEDSRSIA